MLRADLEAAGVPYRDSQGRYADSHNLRHTFITNLARAGTAPELTMNPARHPDVNPTLGRYSHTRVEDRARALDGLPDLSRRVEPQDLRATGTDDMSQYISKPLAAAGNRREAVGSEQEKKAGETRNENANKRKGLAAIGSTSDTIGNEADGGIRTHDPSFTKAVLYR